MFSKFLNNLQQHSIWGSWCWSWWEEGDVRWTLSRGGRQGGSSADGGAGTPQGRSPSPQQSPPVILDKILYIDVICICSLFEIIPRSPELPEGNGRRQRRWRCWGSPGPGSSHLRLTLCWSLRLEQWLLIEANVSREQLFMTSQVKIHNWRAFSPWPPRPPLEWSENLV